MILSSAAIGGHKEMHVRKKSTTVILMAITCVLYGLVEIVYLAMVIGISSYPIFAYFAGIACSFAALLFGFHVERTAICTSMLGKNWG
jgi:hypothetical protein